MFENTSQLNLAWSTQPRIPMISKTLHRPATWGRPPKLERDPSEQRRKGGASVGLGNLGKVRQRPGKRLTLRLYPSPFPTQVSSFSFE